MRAYILHLLRSGECTTYNEILRRVMEEAKPQLAATGATEKETGKVNGDVKSKKKGGAKANGTAAAANKPAVNGSDQKDSIGAGAAVKTAEEGGVRVPQIAVREGIRCVRKELGQVCEVVFEDE